MNNFSLSILHSRRWRRVVPGRLEVPTSTLSVWRSNQLSYRTLWAESGRTGCLFLTVGRSPASSVSSINHLNTLDRSSKKRIPVLQSLRHCILLPLVMHSTETSRPVSRKEVFHLLYLDLHWRFGRAPAVTTLSPERRCSSRTFRYGYLVTT